MSQECTMCCIPSSLSDPRSHQTYSFKLMEGDCVYPTFETRTVLRNIEKLTATSPDASLYSPS